MTTTLQEKQGYKKTELGWIPDEWDIHLLSNLGYTYSGLSGKGKDDFGTGKAFITYMNIFKNVFIDKNCFAYVKIKPGEAQNKVQLWDILFTTSSETPDEVGMASVLLDDIDELYLNSFCFGFRLHNFETLYPQFAGYYFRGCFFRNILNKLAQGATRYNLSKNNLLKSKIYLPSFNEQQKIAEILSSIDKKIDFVDKQIGQAEQLKKALMQELLTKGIGHTEFKDTEIGSIPKGWEVKKLQKLLDNNTVIKHLDGNHGELYPKSEEFVNEGVPYIGANSILGRNVNFKVCKYLNEERAAKFIKGVAYDGDVLFASNATVGPVAILKTHLEYIILSTTLTFYRCDLERLNNYFLAYYMKSPLFINQYERLMKQTTRNQLPITTQRTLYFILPSIEEQKEIAEILNTADNKLEILQNKKSEYEKLKKGLMQKLLTGQIRVRM